MSDGLEKKKENNYTKDHDEFCINLKNQFEALEFEITSNINISLPKKGDIDLVCYDSETIIYIEVKNGENVEGQFDHFLVKRLDDLEYLKKQSTGFKNLTTTQVKYLFFAPKCFSKTLDKLNKKKSNQPDTSDIFVLRNLNEFMELSTQVLPSYAKRELLRTLGVTPPKSDEITVSAIQSKILGNKALMYQFTCSAKSLAKFASVPRRSENHKNTNNYQRLVKGSRLKEIASQHISLKKDFVNNVILKLDKENITFKSYEAVLKKHITNYISPNDIKTGSLTIAMNYNSAFIIDGQHRLLSYLLSENDGLIRVSGLVVDDKIQEARYFVDINSKASKVSQNLIWDLHGDLSPESDEGMISNIFKEVHKGDCSVFAHKLSIPSLASKGKPLSYSGLCRTFKDDLNFKNEAKLGKKSNPFYDEEYDPKKTAKKISTFFDKVFEDFNNDELKLFFNDGVVAVYLKVCKFYYLFGGPKTKLITSLKEYVNSLQKEEILERRKFSNAADKKFHFEQIVLEIQQQHKGFGPEIKTPGISNDVHELEKKLRQWVVGKIVCHEDNMEWFENIFSQKLPLWKKKSRQKFSSERTMEDNLAWDHTKQLITKDKGFEFWANIFEEMFEDKFHNKNDLETSMGNIYDFRSPGDHGSTLTQSSFNKTFFQDAKNDIKKIHSVIDKNPLVDYKKASKILKNYNNSILKPKNKP